MTATEILRHEHQLIRLVMGAARAEARAIRETGRVDAARIEAILDFGRNFIDRCHHAKEEKHFFTKLVERGLPAGQGPIAVMLQEHQEARRLLREVAAALARSRGGDAVAAGRLAAALTAYQELLQAHTDKENIVLFRLADDLFTAADQQTLTAAFEAVEAQEMGAGVHDKYHRLAHDLAAATAAPP